MKYVCALLSVSAVLLGPLMFGLTTGFTGQTIDTMANTVTTADGTPIEIGDYDHLWVLHGSSESSLFGSLVNIGAMFGAFIGGPLIDKFGRKWCLVGCSPCFVLCYLWQALAHTSWQLLFERVLVGIIVGVESVAAPTYIGEASPTKIRGMLGAANQLAVTIGDLLAYALAFGFMTQANSTDPNATSSTFCNWRELSWIYLIPSGLLGIFVFLVPESPRWLAEHRGLDAAKKVLLRLHGTDEDDEDVVDELKAYQITVEAQKAKSGWTQKERFNDAIGGLRKYWIQVVIGVVLQICQQLSGINAVIFYQTSIFQAAGISNMQTMALVTMAIQVGVTFVACCIMDLAGRRVLLVFAATGMCISAWMLGLFFYLQDVTGLTNVGWLALASAYCYIAFFSIGVGPIPWLIMSEIFPNDVRGNAAAIATAVNWLFAFIVTMCLNAYREAITYQGVFWSFGFICLVIIFFVLFFIPETKGKSFEQIEAEFERKYHQKRAAKSAKATAVGTDGSVDEAGGDSTLSRTSSAAV
ncbi:glucose transport protein, putative [Perkinsus marinus ATCC 50983]|uniref:Hexose transporter 1 n=1 Tax=Perkinsus marinus (strain ATCC 50983 / TXsc) TaxID=423536 RepID=C5L739_PERM5|nr:glucose transport protein, putative [Perkinsus marinus ATCC 50983]EER07301.1 glucose transport protein, putative [Perkinsus marinus ATCC 50983]|eukprot:XP_002775485.1 glucose transport protein, putative [Perkinsus marinus ATCC 50983]